jgi:hypothetical protein
MQTTIVRKIYLVGILIMSVFVFATGATAADATPANLRTSGDFVILAATGITTTGTTTVVGDMEVSPVGATAMTGFGLIEDSANECNESECDIHSHQDRRNSLNGGSDENWVVVIEDHHTN